jgi:hypothetical protein
MTMPGLTRSGFDLISYTMRRLFLMGALGATGLTGGCVSVTAPDKPIEINLNINVTQQVVYRLDGQAKALIDENPGIF